MKIKKGQIFVEVFWVILFLLAMTATLTRFYEEAHAMIEKKRIGKMVNHERTIIKVR